MPWTIHRYIIREILSPFVLGLVTFTTVLLMGRMLKLVEMVVSKGVPLGQVLLLILYLLPNLAVITVPVALLLSVLMAFCRLSADGEIIALKASGISLYRLLPPVMTVAISACLLTVVTAVYALPMGNVAFKELLYHVIEGRLNVTIKEQVFNNSIPGMVIYIDRHDNNSGELQGVLIQDERNPKQISTIFAQRGKIGSDSKNRQLRLQLSDGSIHQAESNNNYRHLDFQQYDLSIDLGKSMKTFEKNETDMTLEEIRGNLRTGGLEKKLAIDMKLETQRRFALPFACIIFALVAMPLGIQNRRTGKAAGFTLSILVILAYYILQAASRTLGERELLGPALAIWLPNIMFLAAGAYFFRQAAAERSIVFIDRLLSMATFLFRIFGKRGRK